MKTAHSRLAHLAAHGTPQDPETAEIISVGLEQTLEQFDSEVFPYLSMGGTEIQFIFGQNGRGKTHYLFAVEAAARKRGMVTARIDCAPGQSPFGDLRTTYEMIASRLTPPDHNGEFPGGVAEVIRRSFEGGAPNPEKNPLTRLAAAKQLCPEFRNLVLAYGRDCLNDSFSAQVRGDLEALLTGSRSRVVKVSDLYRSHKGLPRPLGRITAKYAGNWIRSILSLPQALGYEGIVILFDETERAFHGLKARETQKQLANLRNLVDYCAMGAFGGCLILYAAADDFIDLARENLDALAQRVEPATLLKTRFSTSLRSVWTDLDDLTVPPTDDSEFFELLASKIIELGVDAGLAKEDAARVMSWSKKTSAAAAVSPTSAIVRGFVKGVATAVIKELKNRG